MNHHLLLFLVATGVMMMQTVKGLYAGFHIDISRGYKPVTASMARYTTRSSADDISSASNGRVKLLKSLNLKKKREEHQLVLLEGHRMVIDAIRAGAQPHIVLYSDKGASSPLGNRLELALRSIQNDCFVSRVPNSVVESISDTVTSQGVVAAFQLPSNTRTLPEIIRSMPINEKPMVVVLDSISDPGNLGTMIRSAYGMGASAVVTVNGCDIWSPKVLRSAMGLQLLSNSEMPVLELSSWSELQKVVTTYKKPSSLISKPTKASHTVGIQVVIADAHEDNIPHYDVDFTQPSIILIGSEAHGVSKEAHEMQGNVIHTRIPMARPLESFNAAVAGSVLLAEAARQRQL